MMELSIEDIVELSSAKLINMLVGQLESNNRNILLFLIYCKLIYLALIKYNTEIVSHNHKSQRQARVHLILVRILHIVLVHGNKYHSKMFQTLMEWELMILLCLLIRRIRKYLRKDRILRLFTKMEPKLWRPLPNLFILMELWKKILTEEPFMVKTIDYQHYLLIEYVFIIYRYSWD